MLLVITLIKILGVVIPLLIAVAYLTLAERKVMSSIQRRKGPNVVGFYGFYWGIKVFDGGLWGLKGLMGF